DPIHKITIIPRGMALGLTQQLPIDEKHTYKREYLLANIAILLGGRAAEELILKDFSTGAGNDIERATSLARKMVCEWGMSDRMGPLSYGKKEEMIFLGREIATHKDYSEETAEKIDEEVSRIVTESYDRARKLLLDHLEILHRLAAELLEKEVLNTAELDAIIGLKTSPPEDMQGEKPEQALLQLDN
ncbi:MAG: cell division protein FtsH, partial [Syntrophales bacterium]|nr:cell division protein FtsH [Syntrophales bacterium]